jgi:hypothetical protein
MTAPYEAPFSIPMSYGRLFSHNVVVTFVFKLTVGLAYGVWSSGQASLWISKLYEDPHSLPGEDRKTAALVRTPLGWLVGQDLYLLPVQRVCFPKQ